ncbi:MAG: hypothetical protein ACP5VP_08470 [Candidatus Limnocylindrales bacterium]
MPASGPRSHVGLLLGDVPIRRIGLGLAVLAAVVYVASNPLHSDFYNHFVWQAQAWLQGRLEIAFPVSTGQHQNGYFQDVIPDPGHPGLGILPFPPLPALVLVPVVAVLGLATPASLIAALLGAMNVGLAWRLSRRLAADRGVALAATILFGFGTVAWYAAAIGSTWFLAHVVALGLTLLAVTVAVEGDAAARRWAPGRPAAGAPGTPSPGGSQVVARGIPGLVNRRAFVAGLLLGLAALSRLTVAFGAPFLVLVGSGTWRSRLVSAAVGVALPLAALAGYNLALTGHLFNPAYAAIARVEYHPVPALYHANWGVEDLRYIPQNALLALFQLPTVRPQCGLALLDPSCGTLRPDPIGMGLFLSSPGYLLLLPAVRRVRRSRLMAGALAAVGLIGLADLAHFSQGWVQFGWRFSNDFAPFALVPITLVMARWGLNRWVLLLIGLSVAINLWGVYWGVVLGW